MSGPRNARSAGSKRLYSWRNENFWSVTTIIGGGVPKPALLPWGIKSVAEFAVKNADLLPRMVETSGEDEAVRWLKGSPYTKRDKAADLGTQIHAAVEAHSLGRPMPPWPVEIAAHMHQFERFLADFSPVFEATEATVFNRTQRYAGTLDSIIRILGRKLLLDVKSGRDVYAEVALQLAAYRFSEFIGMPDGTEVPMIPVDGAAALHLTDHDYRLIPVRADEEVWRFFLYAREVFKWQEEVSKEVLGEPLSPLAGETTETGQAVLELSGAVA